MPCPLERALQRRRACTESNDLFEDAQTFAAAVEIGVQDPVQPARVRQSDLILSKSPVVE